MSLFDDLLDNEIQIAHPEPSKEVETWSALDRLNKEKDLVGLFLSAHPLDEYKYQLLYACNTTMADLESIPNPRSKDEQEAKWRELSDNHEELERIRKIQSRDITCGGLVTGWREGTSKSGNPYGILTVEDYSGKHEFAFFGAAYPQWRGFGKEGMYLYIQAKYQPKRFVREVRTVFDVELSIGSIRQLDHDADNLLESLTVVLDSSKLDMSTIQQLVDTIACRSLEDKNNQQEGEQMESHTALYFEIEDPETNYSVRLYSRKVRARITRPLIDFLMSMDGVSCKINEHPVEDQTSTQEDVQEEMQEEEMLQDD